MPSDITDDAYAAASDRLHRLETNGGSTTEIAATVAELERLDQQYITRQLSSPRTRAGQS